jgi:hypothetical protein
LLDRPGYFYCIPHYGVHPGILFIKENISFIDEKRLSNYSFLEIVDSVGLAFKTMLNVCFQNYR